MVAKNGHFFIDFWPIFDIFHRLLPYLGSKTNVLGFYKQATHRRPGDEPFFFFGVQRSWLRMAQKWSIFDQTGQTWQAWQHSKVVQKGPNGQPKCFWRPLWAHLDSCGTFQTKINFFTGAPPSNPSLSIWGNKFSKTVRLSLRSPGWQNLAAFRRGQKWPWKFLSSALLQFLRQMRRFCALSQI